jgi:hypothetical protein
VYWLQVEGLIQVDKSTKQMITNGAHTEEKQRGINT